MCDDARRMAVYNPGVHRSSWKTPLAAMALLSVLCGCWGQAKRQTGDDQACIDVSGLLADKLAEQHAVAALPNDVQADLMESLKAGGRLCLVAPTVGVSCNAGGARAPDMRRCCKFARAPEADLTGVPRRIRVGRDADPDGQPVVDLELRGMVQDLALDQRCEVPTCGDDAAAGRAQIDVSGQLVAEGKAIVIDLRIDLGQALELTCSLPPADEPAS